VREFRVSPWHQLWDEQLSSLTMHCSALSFPAELPAIVDEFPFPLFFFLNVLGAVQLVIHLIMHCFCFSFAERMDAKLGESPSSNQRDLETSHGISHGMIT